MFQNEARKLIQTMSEPCVSMDEYNHQGHIVGLFNKFRDDN